MISKKVVFTNVRMTVATCSVETTEPMLTEFTPNMYFGSIYRCENCSSLFKTNYVSLGKVALLDRVQAACFLYVLFAEPKNRTACTGPKQTVFTKSEQPVRDLRSET